VDASRGFAFYWVGSDLAKRLLSKEADQFQVLELGGRCAVSLFFVDYRESDLGAYREFGLALYVTPRHAPLALGTWICNLPVSDPFARDAGVKIWGYPKVCYDRLH
jgi:hypothetical protein